MQRDEGIISFLCILLLFRLENAPNSTGSALHLIQQNKKFVEIFAR